MNTYAIYEGNLERLEKKIQTIKNKCIKYGASFHYAVVGEEFRSYKDKNDEEHTIRFVLVEAEGQVIHQDWEFIAVVAHEQAGNIIRQFNTNIEVPEKYYTSEPVCEHCNTKRRRKDTYLIHNTTTGEWKQVGKTCLNEFTNGMDAEEVARYISLFDELIKGESFSGVGSYETYTSVREILAYAFETVKHFGYQPASEWESYPTRSRCDDFYSVCTGRTRWLTAHRIEQIKEEMELVKFHADSEDNKKLVDDSIAWVLSQDDSNNSYMHNLKVICSSDWCSSRNLGILISLAHTYRKHIKAEEIKKVKNEAHDSEAASSNFVGSEGERITFKAVDVTCVYTSESIYGLSFMYKMHDEDGNVMMWTTGNSLDVEYSYTVTGTVKKHEEYRGVKQTWLTRCRVTQLEKVSQDTEHAEGTFNLDEVLEVFNS